MARLSFSVLICLLIAGSYCQDHHIPLEPTHKSGRTLPPNTTSTTYSTTTISTTTKAPTPTTISTTTKAPTPTTVSTTTKAPTPTTSNTTTTPTPPTTAIPHNTTTNAPITTSTTPVTSTTVKPTPMPDPGTPDWGNWTVLYKNSTKACIVLDIAVQFEIIATSNKSVKINLPKNATATGICDNNDQWLGLNWGVNNSLRFDFSKTNNDTKFELENITTTLVLTTEKGAKTLKLVHNKAEFSTPLSNSYKCARVQSLNLTESTSNETVAYFHMSHAQFQAFGKNNGHKFDVAMDCESSSTPDVVPIVVGCVLALLVVMVLIAYLIGRRRCQARGYLSM